MFVCKRMFTDSNAKETDPLSQHSDYKAERAASDKQFKCFPHEALKLSAFHALPRASGAAAPSSGVVRTLSSREMVDE